MPSDDRVVVCTVLGTVLCPCYVKGIGMSMIRYCACKLKLGEQSNALLRVSHMHARMRNLHVHVYMC